MQVKPKHIGRFVRVQYDDVGADDGILLSVDRTYLTYFSLQSGKVTTNNGAPVIAIGKYVNAKESGL